MAEFKQGFQYKYHNTTKNNSHQRITVTIIVPRIVVRVRQVGV